MTANQKKKPSATLNVLADLMALPISLIPVICAWGLPVYLLRETWSQNFFYVVLALLPLVSSLTLILSVRIIRLFIPRLQKGVFPLGTNRGFMSWYLHLALSRAGDLSGLKPIIQSFYILKFLYWRAQGAKIAFGVNSAMGVSIVDYPMIQVGAGSTLSDGCSFSAHTFVDDKILIAPVLIGENVFVGFKSFVGARSRIGSNVRIGIHNLIAGDIIESGTTIENFAWERGNPNRKFSNNQSS